MIQPTLYFPVCDQNVPPPSSEMQTLVSPEYPNTYPNDLDCTLTLIPEAGNAAVILEFDDFGVLI